MSVYKDIDKTTVCACITKVCRTNGWAFQENVKSSQWKADIVVEYSNYKVAFNICKNPREVEQKVIKT